MSSKKELIIKIDEQLKTDLKVYCARKNIPMTKFCADAIFEYLCRFESEDRKKKDVFIKNNLEVPDDYDDSNF